MGSPTHPRSASTISSNSNTGQPSSRTNGSNEVLLDMKPTSLFNKNIVIEKNKNFNFSKGNEMRSQITVSFDA